MNIGKKFWEWDEALNPTVFKLGEDIASLVSEGLLFPSKDEEGTFEGKDGYPWKVHSQKGLIKSVFFREVFFPFPNTGIWDMEFKKLIPYLNEKLVPINEEVGNSDKLYVVFRDFFVAIIGIIRN